MNDEQIMELAIQQAQKGMGKVFPNPLVGCVIVKDNQILATGYHHEFGAAHAEVDAIQKLSPDQLKGASLYVTLEPCCHYGKTPPCVDLIIQSQIQTVYIGCVDPNPLVNHQGIQKLQDAGIQVVTGVASQACWMMNRIFMTSMETHQPYLLAKYAMSVDGKIATKTLASQWISNQACRDDSNYLRGQYQAIMVGINTVKCDNPRLTCRVAGMTSPIRVILDTDLEIDLDSFVVQDALTHPTWILTTSQDETKQQALVQLGVKLLKVKTAVGKLMDIDECLDTLYQAGIISILVEGGSQLLGSLLTSHKIHELICYVGHQLIGGNQALTPIGGEGFSFMDETTKLKLIEYQVFDQDLKLHYIVERKP